MKKSILILLSTIFISAAMLFSTTAHGEVLNKYTYFDENFNSFSSNTSGTRYPSGWYFLMPNGTHSVSGMFSVEGQSGNDDDKALSLQGSTETRIIKQFSTPAKAGETVYVELDINYSGESGSFYLFLLPETDLEYDTAIHGSGSTYSFNKNILCNQMRSLGSRNEYSPNNEVGGR